MSLLEKENRLWNFVSFNSNRGIVGLGLLEAYMDFNKILGIEEIKPLLTLMPNEVAAAHKRLAEEFLLRSRKLTVLDGGFRDLETLDEYKKAPYKGRSLREALELLVAEAEKNNIKLPKVLKKTGWNKKGDDTSNKELDSEKEYLPTKEDCEKAIEALKQEISLHQISEKEVLNYLEFHLKDKSIHLTKNWREVTRKNFESWFCR